MQKLERTFGFRFVNFCWNSMSASSVPAMPSFEALLDNLCYNALCMAFGVTCYIYNYMKSQLACVACVACVLPHSLESWHQNKSDKKSCSAYHVVSISKRLYPAFRTGFAKQRTQSTASSTWPGQHHATACNSTIPSNVIFSLDWAGWKYLIGFQ